jgi:hypothetical protein
MTTMRNTLRRAVVGTALLAAAAVPLQSGVAHAATPDEEFSSCITTVDATYRAALDAGTDFDISAAIGGCVDTFVKEIGVGVTASSADASATADSVDTGTPDTVVISVDGVASAGLS